MEQLALEVLQPVDLGPLPATQAAHAGEEQVRRIFNFLVRLLRLVFGPRPRADVGRRQGSLGSRAGIAWAPNAEVPLARGLVIPGVHDTVLELDVAHEFVLVYYGLEVGTDLGTWGVKGRPIGLVESG